MLQIVSISQARTNLSKLIKKIKETKQPVIIVQDSSPSVIIYPYDEAMKNEEKKEQQFEKEFQTLREDGRKLWLDYAAKNKIKKNITEEKAYELIKNA